MVETIGPTGHTGGRRTTLAALASFVPGALLGGVATFGALAAAGSLLHGAGGRVAYGVAAAIALLAAVAEARGMRIVPQIRRQVPEHWRRVMPLPLAAFLYGILLGLGFTTFVLSFGVWALAGISFALGEPSAGIAIGLAFGAGRALPVLAIAPFCDREAGIRVTELMTQRPAIYRGFRLGDALALAVGRGGGADGAARRRSGASGGRLGRAGRGQGGVRLPERRGTRDASPGRSQRPAPRSPAGDRRPLHRGAAPREDRPPGSPRPLPAWRLFGCAGRRCRGLGRLGRLPDPPRTGATDQGEEDLPSRASAPPPQAEGSRERSSSAGPARSLPRAGEAD